MHHLSEHIIERLLKELALEPHQSEDVRAHLAECAECRAIYSWLKSFYRELDHLDVRTQKKKEGSDLFPAGTIYLSPVSFKSPGNWNGSPRMILAADAEEEESRYEHTVTLAADNTQYIIRILHDKRVDGYRLFVVGPENLTQNSLVELALFNKELITNEKGKVDFCLSRNIESRKWNNIDATLRTPVANVYLNEEQMAQMRVNGSLSITNNGYEIRLEKKEKSTSFENHEKITITIHSQHAIRREIKRVLLKNSSRQTLLKLNNSQATIDWPTAESFAELSILGYE